jgi:hypothetical protein
MIRKDTPSVWAADCKTLVSARLKLEKIAMVLAAGTNSRSSPSRLPTISKLWKAMPVILPPGRLKLATKPSLTGSAPVTKTIGIVVVAALAAAI